MKTSEKKLNPGLITALILSSLAFILFLFQTKILYYPLLLFIISLFLLVPYRNESKIVKRLVLLIVIVFIGWVLSFLGVAVIPFISAFLLAYLFDPVVTFLARHKFPRLLSALFMTLVFVGIVSLIAVFLFPAMFAQLNDVSQKISSLVTTVSSYLETRKLYKLMDSIGIRDASLQQLIRREMVPEIKNFITQIFDSLLSTLKSISGIATQALNAILIPVFTFYLLKDFDKLRKLVTSILEKKDAKLLNDTKRINDIFKIYIGWQLLALTIVATVCITVFSIFQVSYPVVLGVICGILNPIPYLGILASMVICCITILLLEPENMWTQIMVILITINSLHFINAYLIEPNILGKRVGLHPIVLFASLFVFGAFFGFLGLLVAVPCTAAMMLFFNDWRLKMGEKLKTTDSISSIDYE